MKFPWPRRAAIDEELRTHVQMATQDRIARGESPDEAARSARREFGNEILVLEATRNAWGWVALERLALEMRCVLRRLRRSPGFTFTAVFTLAVGLGGAIAAFSVVNSVLLEPLPYKSPDRLFSVLNLPPPGVANKYTMINPRHFHEWREHCRLCDDVGAAIYATAGFTLTEWGEPERFPGLRVSYNFFRTLGVKPALGRDFNREEELLGDHRKVLIADSVWRSRFGADPSVIGRTLQINGESYVLIGVMPPNLTLPRGNQWGGDTVAEFVPVMFRPLAQDVSQGNGSGNTGNFLTVARLKPEVQAPQAASEFFSLIADFVREFKLQTRPVLLPLHGTMVRESRVGLWLLLGIAVALLLIVCVNVGNLMLVRAPGRNREVGIRMSVGASRQQLFMLLLSEALILVLCGSAIGVGFAYSLLKGIVAWAPRDLRALIRSR